MMEYKSKCCAVVDNGLFIDLATSLVKDFGKVYYNSPAVDAFISSNATVLGKGIPGVTRVDDIWKIADEVNLWIFPDCYYGGLQLHLESLGKRVWGARMGEELELDRVNSKRHLKKLGINIGPYVVVKGLEKLREHLKAHEDQWVKVSRTRGDVETFHSPNYKLIEPVIDELENKLGAKKELMEFIVEEGIPDAVEVAYDGFTVDGLFPGAGMVGIEVKGKSYVGIFQDAADMPEQITEPNEKLADTLKRYRYRNWLSLEMRITEGGAYHVIDPCCRFGSPPGELVPLMYTNLAEIFWEGADGKLVEPVPSGKYGVELRMESQWARDHWLPVYFPTEIRDHVRLRNMCIIDGTYYIVPQSAKVDNIGGLVATGDTLEAAIEEVKGYASQVEAYGLDIFEDSLDQAQEEIEKLAKMGVEL
jgi:hypothetical protein